MKYVQICLNMSICLYILSLSLAAITIYSPSQKHIIRLLFQSLAYNSPTLMGRDSMGKL